MSRCVSDFKIYRKLNLVSLDFSRLVGFEYCRRMSAVSGSMLSDVKGGYCVL